MSENELPHYAEKALNRLKDGRMLVREASDTDEAIQKGGGYLYSIHPGGRKFPTASGKLLIEKGAVLPRRDGLFSGNSQTFIPA